jgi:chemotaxis protein MotB
MKRILIYLIPLILLTSCVSKKKFLKMNGDHDIALQKTQLDLENCNKLTAELQAELDNLKNELASKNGELIVAKGRAADLQDQLDFLKLTNTNLLDRLSDLSVISKTGAESIKQSLESLNERNEYIKSLTSSIAAKDSINLALVMNLKRSLDNINDEDINIEVKKGVVYISISDKMLFKSGSATINATAETVLGKIAKVVNDHSELDILVEGHTDNVPISNSCISDNWDLSVKRATSVVRVLQKKYNVDPSRMTAGGRSEFAPKDSNESKKGRSTNRRTEIIITPKLDQFFQLMEPPKD